MSSSYNNVSTHAELQNLLGISSGQLTSNTITIGKGGWQPSMDDVIDHCFSGQNIVLTNASLVADHGQGQGVEISGQCSVLDMPNLDVTLFARVVSSDELHFDLECKVIGSSPDPDKWKLSMSVPGVELPDPTQEMVLDRTTGTAVQPTYKPLDTLKFFDTRFWVTNHKGHSDPDLGLELNWGVNLLSMVRPEGPIAMVNQLMGEGGDLKVSGTIRRPSLDETIRLLTVPYGNRDPEGKFPWDTEGYFGKGVPGVNLKIHLGIQYDLEAGQIEFAADHLHLYMPYDDTWSLSRTAPTFEPQQAFAGSINLPGANMNLDFMVPFDFEANYLTFKSRIEGLSLGNLSDLSGIAGQNEDLFAKLPQELQDLAGGLGNLSLTNLAVDLDFRNGSQIHIPRLIFQIGMPDVTWSIWDGHFSVGNLWTKFDIRHPFQTPGSLTDPDQQRSVKVSVGGTFQIEGVDFHVKATSQNDFAVYAEMDIGSTIPLGNVLNSLGAGINNPGDLNISTFRVGVAPGKNYNLAMGMNENGNGWGIDLGGTEYKVSDVYVNLNKSAGEPAEASLGGVIALGDLGELSIDYDAPGDIRMVSWFDEVKLGDMIETLVGKVVDLPAGFEFDLEDVSILIEKEGSDYKFQIATEIDTIGTLALIINKVGGQWGVAFGIQTYLSKLSDLPGLSSLSALDGRGAPDSLLVIVSNIDRPDFQFPGLAQFDNPDLNANGIPVPSNGGLTDGLNLYATWRFGNGDQGTNTLLNLLNLSGDLDVTVSIPTDPTNGTRLFLTWDGKMLDKYDLEAQLGLQLTNGSPELFLGGTMKVPIQGDDCIFDVALSVLTTGVYFSGSMNGTVSFEGFQLSNLGVMFGYNWALIPSIGIMANIDTSDFSTSIAMLFDSGDPSKSVMAGSISDISLKGLANELAKVNAVPNELTDILETISIEGINEFTVAATLATALDDKDQATVAQVINDTVGLSLPSDSENLLIVVNKAGERWNLTDVRDSMKHYELELENGQITGKAKAQIYLAPQGITLGGFTFTQGFRVQGALSVLGLTWTSDIEISNSKGIAATSYLDDDLVIWNENFFKLSDQTGESGPRFSLATYSRPEQQDPLFQEPHFMLDGKLNLLGTETTAYVKFNTGGFEFLCGQETEASFDVSVFEGSYGMDWEISGAIGKDKGIQLDGDFDFHLDGRFDLTALMGAGVNMGDVSISTNASVTVDTGFDGSNGHFNVSGSFNFLGASHSFSFALDGEADGIDKIAEQVFQEIKDVIVDLYNSAAEWFAELGQSIVNIADEIAATAEVVGTFFGESAQQVASYLKDLGADADRIATELVNNSLETADLAIAEILKGLDFAADEIAGALSSALNTTAQRAAEILQDLLYTWDTIAGALQSAFNQTAEQAAQILENLGATADEIAGALSNAYHQTAEQVGRILKNLGHGEEVIAEALKNAFNSSMEEVANVIKNIGWGAYRIANALKAAFNATAEEVSQILKDLNYLAKNIAASLKNVFDYTSMAAGEILDGLGYATNVIADALKVTFQISATQAAVILKDLGRTVNEVAGAIKDVYSFTANATADALKQAGYQFTEIGQAMKDVFNKSVSGAADVLKAIGANYEAVSKMIRDVFPGTNMQTVTNILENLGFSTNQIANQLRYTFNVSVSDATKLLRNAGRSASAVAQAISDTYNKGAEEMTAIMRSAGYSALEAGEVLYNLFDEGSEDAGKFLARAGYAASEIASTLRKDALWDKGAKATGKILKKAGFGKSTVKSALRSAGWAKRTVEDVINDIF